MLNSFFFFFKCVYHLAAEWDWSSEILDSSMGSLPLERGKSKGTLKRWGYR